MQSFQASYPSPLKVDTIYDSPSSQNPHSTIKVSLRDEVLSQFKYQSTFSCEPDVESYPLPLTNRMSVNSSSPNSSKR